jgi:drug/metabolite transporter (DMT)-like permease
MSASASWFARAMPWLFVPIWSTGFIVARFGMPHAPPMTFLAMRFALSVMCFAAWVAFSKAVWPRSKAQFFHLAAVGVLMHAGYLGGVWAAVKAGIGAGTVALLVGLQPVLTALWLSTLSRSAKQPAVRLGALQWTGLVLGFGGLVLVVWRKLGAGELNALNLGLAVFALLSITAGSLYQKRFVAACDVRTASFVQLFAALVVCTPLALLESEVVVWHPHLTAALAWSVLGLTLGGSSLLYLLLQRGAATQVASLMFLVPPTTALMAWLIFNETLSPLMLLGMVLTVVGVACVMRPVSSPISSPTSPPTSPPTAL